MNRPRISILGVMGIILVAGLVLALVRAERGIVSSSLEGWANLTSYLTVASLVIATYSARYRKGAAADWWFGFALGGWSYYLFAGDMIWHWAFDLHTRGPSSLVSRMPSYIVGDINYYYSLPPNSEVDSYLRHIAQATLVLLAAAAGGSVCLMLSRQKRGGVGDGIRMDLRCGAEGSPAAEP